MFTAVTGAQPPLRRVQLSFHDVDRAMPFMADHQRRGARPVRDRRALRGEGPGSTPQRPARWQLKTRTEALPRTATREVRGTR